MMRAIFPSNDSQKLNLCTVKHFMSTQKYRLVGTADKPKIMHSMSLVRLHIICKQTLICYFLLAH